MKIADKEYWRCSKCQERVLITSNARTIKYRLEETEKEHNKKCKRLTDKFQKFTFTEILIDAERKYQKKLPIYGESWKNMGTGELRHRLMGEVEELKFSDNSKEDYDELLDIINVACMFAKMLKMEDDKNGRLSNTKCRI